MGRYLFLMVAGLSLLFNTIALRLDQNRVNLAEANSRSLAFAKAKNLSTSGAGMALSRLSLQPDWKDGFNDLVLGGARGKVWVEDHNSNAALSLTERMIVSAAFYDDVSETTMVTIDVSPDIGRYAIYATGNVDKINVYDEHGFRDHSLLVENAGVMPPFEWDGLKAEAQLQRGAKNASHDHVACIKNKDHKDRSSFYFKGKTPNITVVYGDLKISGNKTVYGIYVVYGDIILNGNVHVEGVLAMPDPGSVVMHGGGNPGKMNVTGGMLINADARGTGNHISVKYNPEYMSVFANWQIKSEIMVTRWLETPAY